MFILKRHCKVLKTKSIRTFFVLYSFYRSSNNEIEKLVHMFIINPLKRGNIKELKSFLSVETRGSGWVEEKNKHAKKKRTLSSFSASVSIKFENMLKKEQLLVQKTRGKFITEYFVGLRTNKS